MKVLLEETQIEFSSFTIFCLASSSKIVLLVCLNNNASIFMICQSHFGTCHSFLRHERCNQTGFEIVHFLLSLTETDISERI